MDVLRERTEPDQALGNPDQLRLRGLDQAEAGRDDVHFLFTSLNVGLGHAVGRRSTPGVSDRDRADPPGSNRRPMEDHSASIRSRPNAATTHPADFPAPTHGSHRGPEAGLTDRYIVPAARTPTRAATEIAGRRPVAMAAPIAPFVAGRVIPAGRVGDRPCARGRAPRVTSPRRTCPAGRRRARAGPRGSGSAPRGGPATGLQGQGDDRPVAGAAEVDLADLAQEDEPLDGRGEPVRVGRGRSGRAPAPRGGSRASPASRAASGPRRGLADHPAERRADHDSPRESVASTCPWIRLVGPRSRATKVSAGRL